MFRFRHQKSTRHVSKSLPCLLALTGAGALFFGTPGLHAQSPDATESQPAAETQPETFTPNGNTSAETPATENETESAPARVFGEPAVDVPYSSIFRNTNISANTLNFSPALGPSLQSGPFDLQNSVGFSTSGLQLPFVQRGFDPENADLKLGPIYFRFPLMRVGELYTDNENQTPTNRTPAWISIINLDMAVLCQLTEGFQIAVAGSFVYLPLQGKFGPSGYGLAAPLGLEAAPILQSQMTYETMMWGWDVQFFDEFRVGTVSYSNDPGNIVLYSGVAYPWVDQAGRYSFGAPYSTTVRNQSDIQNRSNYDDSQEYSSNRVGFQATRLIPDDIRLSVTAFHENLWYNQNGRGLPSERDLAIISAESEREDLRFKPFASYTIGNATPGNGVAQTFVIGAKGPITDQLSVLTQVGGFVQGNNNTSFIWRLVLQHDAGPNTTESLDFGRSTDTFYQEIATYLSYGITQTLGPSVSAGLTLSGAKVQDLTGNGDSYNTFASGAQITFFLSPRTDFRLSGGYQYEEYTNEILSTWLARCEIDYHFTDSFSAQLYYQYQNQDSNLAADGFYENLVVFTLKKYFQ